MIGHAVRVSLRQIIRRPFLPVLNLVGLAFGIAVSLIILLYAHVEMHYDDWVTDQEDLYRIEGQYKGSWSSYYHLYVVNALGPAVANFPEVKSVVRLIGNHWLIKKGDFVNYETVFLAEDGFLDIFPLEFVNGNASSPFPTKNSVIISADAALQYFGQESAIGQTLTLDESNDFIVSAVFKDVGPRTDYSFKFVVPFQDVLVHEPNSWDVYDSETFVRLHAGASTESLYERIAQLVDEHRPLHKQTDHVMRERFHYFLQPFADLHLGSQGRTEANTIGNYAKIYGFIAIAGLVLMISVFNYIGLATARALEREREFCLRKISGAGFKQILHHTIAESVLLTWLAAILGWVISEAMMPFVGGLLGIEYGLFDLFGLMGAVSFTIAVSLLGFFAGLYPAFMARDFKPAKFLSGGRSSRRNVNRIRSTLVFVQFAICIGLVISAVTISRQMAYVNQLDLGYDANGIVAVYGLDKTEVAPRSDTFKERVAKIAGVEAVTRSRVIPHGSSNWYNVFYSENMSGDETVNLRMIASDYDFIDTYGAKLIAGRKLDPQYAEDTIDMFDDSKIEALTSTRNVIINKEAVRELGFTSAEGAIGKEIFIKINDSNKPLIVVGVIEGMRFYSARRIIAPKIHFHAPNRFRAASLRIDTLHTQEVVSNIQALWAEMFPDVPFQIFFVEELIQKAYASERNQQFLFIVFSCLAILLSLLGLTGLVSNSIAHRSKEISIRRVLGASVSDNVKLLTWQYLRPVLLANIPAWAVAYYFLSDWLEKYPQRIDVGVEYYVLGGMLILLVTGVMTASLVLRTVLLRPAEVLKYE